MSKHTPGPWQVEAIKTRDGGFIVSVPRNDGTCFVSTWVAHVGPFSDEDAANARLISAAPELLSALKALIDEKAGATLAEFAAARRAIAKAEGAG